jgi:hypothetical protein
VLSRAADIAATVPVYALRVVRDLSRVDEVARQLSAWHSSDNDQAGQEA